MMTEEERYRILLLLNTIAEAVLKNKKEKPMPRYIDAEKLERFVIRDDWDTPDERWRPESEFGRFVDAVPTEDVAPVHHAKWLDNKGLYQCSECKHIWSELWWTANCPIDRMNKMMHYCPNCGAKMDKQ